MPIRAEAENFLVELLFGTAIAHDEADVDDLLRGRWLGRFRRGLRLLLNELNRLPCRIGEREPTSPIATVAGFLRHLDPLRAQVRQHAVCGIGQECDVSNSILNIASPLFQFERLGRVYAKKRWRNLLVSENVAIEVISLGKISNVHRNMREAGDLRPCR